jgi:hypothetical protein
MRQYGGSILDADTGSNLNTIDKLAARPPRAPLGRTFEELGGAVTMVASFPMISRPT